MIEKKKIIFHHIPKTAGSTFLGIMSKQYRRSKIYQIDGIKTDKDISQFKTMSSEERDSFDVIMGHQAILLYDYIPGDKLILTFFREPYEQFKSSYFYLKQATHNKHHNIVSKLSIEDYLDYTVDQNLTNQQSKVLFTAHYEDVTDVDLIKSEAIKVLNSKIDIPCITSHFDLSLMLLKRKLEWSSMPYYISKNKSIKDVEVLDQALREAHFSHNVCDYEIYHLATEKFNTLCSNIDERNLSKFNNFKPIFGLVERVKNKII